MEPRRRVLRPENQRTLTTSRRAPGPPKTAGSVRAVPAKSASFAQPPRARHLLTVQSRCQIVLPAPVGTARGSAMLHQRARAEERTHLSPHPIGHHPRGAHGRPDLPTSRAARWPVPAVRCFLGRITPQLILSSRLPATFSSGGASHARTPPPGPCARRKT